MYCKVPPAVPIRARVFASRISLSRLEVWSSAAAVVAISSFATSGHEGETVGDISEPLIVTGAVLDIVPTTAAGPAAEPANTSGDTANRIGIARDTNFQCNNPRGPAPSRVGALTLEQRSDEQATAAMAAQCPV